MMIFKPVEPVRHVQTQCVAAFGCAALEENNTEYFGSMRRVAPMPNAPHIT